MLVQDFLVKRRWIILTFSLAVVTLATSAYLIYREIYRPKNPNDILSKYGYLFREQHVMDNLNKLIQSQNRLQVKETDQPTTDTCKLSCPTKTNFPQEQNHAGNNVHTAEMFTSSNKTASNKTVVDEDEVIVTYIEPMAAPLRDEPGIKYSHHGCCMSNQSFISPTEMKDAETGQPLRIVQFRSKRQYFLTDHCNHVKGCNRGCQCGQQMVIAAALVVDSHSPHKDKDFDEVTDNDYIEKHARIQLVKYSGWCKCFNN